MAVKDLWELQEFVHQMAKLPEKGKEVVRALSQHISAHDWDLSERAMHALRNIASATGAWHTFAVRSHFCSLSFCCRLRVCAQNSAQNSGACRTRAASSHGGTGSRQDSGLRLLAGS